MAKNGYCFSNIISSVFNSWVLGRFVARSSLSLTQSGAAKYYPHPHKIEVELYLKMYRQ